MYKGISEQFGRPNLGTPSTESIGTG